MLAENAVVMVVVVGCACLVNHRFIGSSVHSIGLWVIFLFSGHIFIFSLVV